MKPSPKSLSLAAGLAVLLLSGAVGAWHLLSRSAQELSSAGEALVTTEEMASGTVAASTAEAIPVASAPVPFEASLAQVMASGKDYGCHYKGPANDGDFTATIFVSQGRARGTFVGNIFNEPGSIAYFLMNGERFYLWYILPDSMPEAIRGKAYLNDLTHAEEKEEFRKDLMDQLQDLYGCVPWEFEDRFFELPRDLTYVDETGAIKAR